MSKYDKEREAYGVTPQSSSVPWKSKYATERAQITPISQSNQHRLDVEQSDMAQMDQANRTADSRAPIPEPVSKMLETDQSDAQQMAQSSKYAQERGFIQRGRNLPVIGPVLKTLDTIESNPVRKKAGDIFQMFYTPGAGAANVAALSGAVERTLGLGVGRAAQQVSKIPIVSNALTQLGIHPDAVGRIATRAATEAATGVPLGAGQYLANQGSTGKADLREAAKAGAEGALIGGALGSIGPAIGQEVGNVASKMTNNAASRKLFDELFNKADKQQAYDSAAVNAKYAEAGALPSSYNVPNAQAGKVSDRLRFIDQQVNGNGTLGLPESRGERLLKEAQARSNQYGNEVIYGQGKTVYDDPNKLADIFGLPPGNYVKPQRYKVAGNNETLDAVMQKIKPVVMERMTPPLENPTELARYVQRHLGTSMNELRRLSYDDLAELAKEVSRNMDTYQVAVQTAKEMGYDLPSLLEGYGQNIYGRVAQDAEKRKYGIYPERVNIKNPEGFNTSVTGEAAAPRQVLKSSLQNSPKVEFPPVKPSADAETPVLARSVEVPKETPVQVETAPKTATKVANERGFITTLKESPKTDAGLLERLKSRYDVLPNEKVVDMANKRVSKDLDEATSYVLGKSRSTAEKVTTAHRLIDEYSKRGNHEMAASIAESIAEELTRAGQTVQAASIYNRLTPEGILVHAQRTVSKINEALPATAKEIKLTPDMAAKLTDLASTTQRMTGVKDLANSVESILDKAKSGAKLTEEESAQLRKFVDESKQFVKEVEKKPRELREPKPPKDKKVRDNVISFLDAQEQRAKERLRAKGIRISSTPLDIWADYAIIGAAKMGKGAIKFSEWSEQMLKDLGEEIRPHLENLYGKARETFELSAKKVSQSTYNQADKIVERVLKNKRIDEQDAQSIRKLASQVTNLSGDAKRLASQDLQAILNQLEKPGILKKISSAQTMAQLLNPKTLLVRNPLGNELFYRLERLNKLVAAPVDWGRVKLFGGQRSVTFRTHNQGQYWSNWMAGLRAGWNGVNPEGLQTQFDISSPAFNSKWNPLTYMEKTLGATLKSFDYAAYKRAVNNTIGEMATLRAMNEGLKGDAYKTAIQKYIREADDNILKIADEYGRYVTFQDNNAISKALTGLKRTLNAGKDFGLGDLVIKYPKTPGALLMRALEYSPAGFLRSIKIAAMPILKKSVEPNTAEAIMALTRAAIGTAGLSGLGWYLVDKGILTGAASKDKDIRSLQKSAGQGQYQVNLSALYRWVKSGFDSEAAKLKEGDNLYTYDWAQPVSMAISLGANAKQNVLAGEKKGESSLNLLGTAYNSAEGGLNSLVEQSVLSGVKKAVEGTPGQSVMDKVTDILSDIPSSFVPSAVNQYKQLTDNASRETYSPDMVDQSLNKAKARIPGLAGTLPQQYDTLGKAKQTYQDNNAFNVFNVLLNPGYSSKYELSPEARMIVNLINETGDESLAPRVPAKNIQTKDAKGNPTTQKLTTEQYARIQQLQGEETQRLLSKINPNSSVASQSKRVKDDLTKAGETARSKLKKEMGVK